MGEWGLCCLECAFRAWMFLASHPVSGRVASELISSL